MDVNTCIYLETISTKCSRETKNATIECTMLRVARCGSAAMGADCFAIHRVKARFSLLMAFVCCDTWTPCRLVQTSMKTRDRKGSFATSKFSLTCSDLDLRATAGTSACLAGNLPVVRPKSSCLCVDQGGNKVNPSSNRRRLIRLLNRIQSERRQPLRYPLNILADSLVFDSDHSGLSTDRKFKGCVLM